MEERERERNLGKNEKRKKTVLTNHMVRSVMALCRKIYNYSRAIPLQEEAKRRGIAERFSGAAAGLGGGGGEERETFFFLLGRGAVISVGVDPRD